MIALILTHNEALHIARAVASAARVAKRVIVVDSGSTDATRAIARAAGAVVLKHPFTTHADQINWALDVLGPKAGWILRLDADEYLSDALIKEINTNLPRQPASVHGIYIPRCLHFMGEPVRRGGLYPMPILRLFRAGKARCESRWMDEHMQTNGLIAQFKGTLIDDNHRPLSWWIEKHNRYAGLEVVDILNAEHGFAPEMTPQGQGAARRATARRWLKTKVYARLPSGSRALAYFLYRYILRGGFLDGPEARSFHVLQGFWYRYLVDCKLRETRAFMAAQNCTAPEAIERVLGITTGPARSGLETSAEVFALTPPQGAA
ncbi:glycosyltransferase family 2 protein [Alphaproteobacteria bacterium KMM 3653]|uniref:Glycosyltransferase family 2 protein n=1 Tax=Harenicola maris TaxID=2841044 RepID=A0AAP2G401_9RHOB|nr:glycosyltransferase family 2 protein [Harenicola maris]